MTLLAFTIVYNINPVLQKCRKCVTKYMGMNDLIPLKACMALICVVFFFFLGQYLIGRQTERDTWFVILGRS